MNRQEFLEKLRLLLGDLFRRRAGRSDPIL